MGGVHFVMNIDYADSAVLPNNILIILKRS